LINSTVSDAACKLGVSEQMWELIQRVFTFSTKVEAAYNLQEDLTERFRARLHESGGQVLDSCLLQAGT
jgi:hypothetical protein